MKVLVTGSTGFIGSALVRLLQSKNWAVAGLDRAASPTAPPADYICDLLDKKTLSRSLQDFAPDAVIHLAARTDLDERVNLSGYAANIEGVENLIAAIKVTPSVRRAIWTSSQLVCKVGYVPKTDTDYNADTLYGQSKIRTEQIVRQQDGAGREWCLVRPTTVWGPGMSAHYQKFLRMIQSGYYFHVGRTPLLKSYSFIGNIAFQYVQLLNAPVADVHRRMFYLADYEPIDLIAWCNAFQCEFQSRPIPFVPQSLAKAMAVCGDIVNAFGFRRFPFNSFRLNNILTQYQFDLEATRAVCGPLPYTMAQGVAETARWLTR
jgi:nucleoside-diphosphate-sugar epimerase